MIKDVITIRRVANGWIVHPGDAFNDFTHVYADPTALAAHIEHWAKAQIDPSIVKRTPPPS
jgi:hypothetical protein